MVKFADPIYLIDHYLGAWCLIGFGCHGTEHCQGKQMTVIFSQQSKY